MSDQYLISILLCIIPLSDSNLHIEEAFFVS